MISILSRTFLPITAIAVIGGLSTSVLHAEAEAFERKGNGVIVHTATGAVQVEVGPRAFCFNCQTSQSVFALEARRAPAFSRRLSPELCWDQDPLKTERAQGRPGID